MWEIGRFGMLFVKRQQCPASGRVYPEKEERVDDADNDGNRVEQVDYHPSFRDTAVGDRLDSELVVELSADHGADL